MLMSFPQHVAELFSITCGEISTCCGGTYLHLQHDAELSLTCSGFILNMLRSCHQHVAELFSTCCGAVINMLC